MKPQIFRTKVNKALSGIPSHDSDIPLTTIFDIIESNGGMAIDEAGERWSGMLCGADGNANIVVKHPEVRKDFYLNITWHKMNSGWETVVYLS